MKMLLNINVILRDEVIDIPTTTKKIEFLQDNHQFAK